MAPLDLEWEVCAFAPGIDAFRVVVFGIVYRTAKSPDDVIIGPEPVQAAPVPRGQSGQVAGEPGKRDRADQNPYAHLYGLLYPPPDELATDHLPAFNQLYDYQKHGVTFLVMREHALLADDMGLGKTAQCAVAMAVLLRSERIRNALVICPRALVPQWCAEALRWGNLLASPVDGTPMERLRIWQAFLRVRVVTPQILLNDIETVRRQQFDLVVCDDVTMLKNPGKTTVAIRSVPRRRSWCLNGTPLENKPEDFANVMEFVRPGLFSASERQQAIGPGSMQRRVEPYFLRRRKKDCLKDLKEKQVFEPLALEMDTKQAHAYRRAETAEWNEVSGLGTGLTKVHVFARIMRLLQICNYDRATGESAKADEIGEQLEMLYAEGDDSTKAIVFSRWTDTLDFLAERWRRHHPVVYYGGLSPSERERILAHFREGSGKLLLMSTKAGSRGLNLQEANYVFHFDRTWNPVDEWQAEDRCWRMGQQRTVFVYRYCQVGTIEERLHEVLTAKQSLFRQYVDEMPENLDVVVESEWSISELMALLRPSAHV